jgi:hypothetical protein
MKRGIPFLLGLLSLSACKSNVITEQGLLVTVDSSDAGIVSLSVSLSNGGTGDTLTFPSPAQTTPIRFPTSFSVSVPATRRGAVDIAISGLNESRAMVANGTASTNLKAGTFVPVTVSLQPGATPDAGGSGGAVGTDGAVGTGGAAGLDATPLDAGIDQTADVAISTGGVGGGGGSGGVGGSPGLDGAYGTGGADLDASLPDAAVADALDAPLGGSGGGSAGSGGHTSSGGITGGGGGPGTGGAASGGGASSGGATGSGGANATGGATSAAGAPGTGGATVAGGTSGTGGTPGTGGATFTGSFVNPAPGSKFFVGANFWNDEWEPASDLFISNVNWTTTTNPWNPALLSDLAPYAHVLRFMDWNRTNDQVDGSWATRAQPNVAPGDRGVAYEWQIDLCNRAHVDYWINVPTLADDDHVTKLAQLIQEKLDPGLRIYIEYSNGVWNAGFPQSTYVSNQGVAANMPGVNQSYQGWAWYVFRSVQVFQGFEAVFGNNSPRLVKVLSGQANYAGDASNPAPLCVWHLQSLADKTVNPQGETINAYAIAPYFAGQTTSALSADIPNEATYVQNHVACLKGTGIPLISYEGGQDSFAATSCSAVATDPAMTNLYVTYLNAMMAAGMAGPFNQYTHVGNCWGLKMASGDSNANAPKYQGVLNWVAAHP